MKVLILKGDSGKSVIVETLLKNMESYCYVYYNKQLPFDSGYINSDYHSLTDVIKYLEEDLEADKENNAYRTYEYFILYTNNTENELVDVIKWLEQNGEQLCIKNVIVTCK